MPVTDLAAASSLFSELFIQLAASHAPMGIELEPPLVMVSSGSIPFVTTGTLLAAGIGILLAYSGGLVAAPIGYIEGSILASAGAIDAFLGWKRSIAEARKLDAEAHKLDAERAKLVVEARKLDADRAKVIQEMHRLSSGVGHEPPLTPPASAYISRSDVQVAAKKQRASEAYANHVLNRLVTNSSQRAARHLGGHNKTLVIEESP